MIIGPVHLQQTCLNDLLYNVKNTNAVIGSFVKLSLVLAQDASLAYEKSKSWHGSLIISCDSLLVRYQEIAHCNWLSIYQKVDMDPMTSL